ncbi:MAG TPA: TadE/TadG family type IV pilus assembly protein [Dongiaceae bacterium]|nr:TadE/TadG family type IV pilus assembly protein [Dongiaceae bacterium]
MFHDGNRLAQPLTRTNRRSFARDRRGAVSVMFAVSLIALVPAIGIAVDFARVVQFKSALQNAVDNAALAGASAFTDATLQSAALATAKTYMSQSLAGLQANGGVTVSDPVGKVLTSNGSTTGFTVQIGATGSISTTFMSAIMKTMAVSVTATAENPILIINITKPYVTSDAGDKNVIYAYPIPLDGSLPKDATLVPIADNTSLSNQTSVPVKLAASQNLGFALQNTTGGNTYNSQHVLVGYGKNSYAAPFKSVNTFYSQSTKISTNTTQTDSTSKAKYAANTKNCSLVSKDLGSGTTAQNSSPTAPTTGSCFSTTPGQYTQNMKLDCTKNAGETIRYFWNDMGGSGSDDKDYNDMAFNVTCPNTAGTPKGVALIQ